MLERRVRANLRAARAAVTGGSEEKDCHYGWVVVPESIGGLLLLALQSVPGQLVLRKLQHKAGLSHSSRRGEAARQRAVCL